MKMHCIFVRQTIDNEDYLQPSPLGKFFEKAGISNS